VLIDFGAVKAFQSENAQLESQNGQSRFTVSIGTPGYMASEQMAGRPNFASDLYSLGMVVIRGLTGIEPTELPTNPDTGEVVWKDKAKVSNGLAMVLTRMTRYSYPQRFQSAREVLQGITAFCPNEELPTPTTIKNTTHLSQSRKSTLHEPIRTVPLSSDKSSSPSRSFTRELLIVFGLLVLGLPVWLLSTARKPEPVASPPASTDTPIAPPTTPTETIIPEITVQPILLNEKQQAVVTGSVKANGVVKYSVEGKQGQTISLQLLGQGTTMNILNPNGQSVSQQVNNFGDTYRTDGIYTIEVKGTGAETANFTLSVAVIGEPVVQPTEPAPNPEVAPPNTENQSSQ
jgi:serine/threonine-protein kinase